MRDDTTHSPSASTSKLLLDTPPECFQQDFAKAAGLGEAIITQKLHYLLINAEKAGRNYRDGRYWIYNSIPEWRQTFWPWWSERTIRRLLKSLENKKILITGCYNKLKVDQTTWYTINYDHPLFSGSHAAKLAASSGQDGRIQPAKKAAPIPADNPAAINSNLKSSCPRSDEPDMQNAVPGQDNNNPKGKQLRYDPDSIEITLAQYLLSKILERDLEFKQPRIQAWAKDIDLLLRVDGRRPEDVRRVIDWSQRDPFWVTIILSPAALRRKYDQLRAKIQHQGDIKHEKGSSNERGSGLDVGHAAGSAGTQTERIPADEQPPFQEEGWRIRTCL